MKALKVTGIIIGTLIVIVVLLVVLLPAHSHMERSTVIGAPPAQVFAKLNSFKSFNTWSPWADLDPNTRYEYSGPEQGVGASMSWNSDNKNVGSGTQKIVESETNRHIKNEMTFGDMEGTSYANFELSAQGDSTRITWTYDGDMSGLGKIFGLMMDQMLGPSYEKGLAKLKNDVESNTIEPIHEIIPTDSTLHN
jgi:hypothetical protein